MKKKQSVWIALIVGILICAFLVYIPTSESHREHQYEQALEYYRDSFYEAAYDLFYPLRNWKPEADAYAHVCRARILVDTGDALGASREMLDVENEGFPADLELAIDAVNRTIDIALSHQSRANTTPPRTITPASTPKPVWSPPPSTGHKSYDEDEYDASDYDDPDDFYYDHYDDFFEYYDAEDYWYEHHDD